MLSFCDLKVPFLYSPHPWKPQTFYLQSTRLPMFSKYLSLAYYADSYTCPPVSGSFSLQLLLPLRPNITVKKQLLSGGTFPSFPSLHFHSLHWTSKLAPTRNCFSLIFCLCHMATTTSIHYSKKQTNKFRHVQSTNVPSSWRSAWKVVNFNITYRGL